MTKSLPVKYAIHLKEGASASNCNSCPRKRRHAGQQLQMKGITEWFEMFFKEDE